jgi:hypothetical protein
MLGDQERVIFPNTALAYLSIGDKPSNCIGAARMRPGGRGYDVDRAIRC